MKRTGSPSGVTWFTGPSVSPIPCVKVSRSLMNVRVGSEAAFSSPGETSTWRYSPSIQ